MGFLCWLGGKKSSCEAGDSGNTGSIPGWGRSLEKEMATHSSILENPMDRAITEVAVLPELKTLSPHLLLSETT